MSRGGVRMNWKGKEVARVAADQAAEIMGEFALRAEGHSKRELQKGHGVLTGTLRRSIHVAEPGYDFAADDLEPSENSPERGGICTGCCARLVIAAAAVRAGLAVSGPNGLSQGESIGAFSGIGFRTTEAASEAANAPFCAPTWAP